MLQSVLSLNTRCTRCLVAGFDPHFPPIFPFPLIGQYWDSNSRVTSRTLHGHQIKLHRLLSPKGSMGPLTPSPKPPAFSFNTTSVLEYAMYAPLAIWPLILYLVGVAAETSFQNPPDAGALNGQWRDNPQYQVGETLNITWYSDTYPLSLYLCMGLPNEPDAASPSVSWMLLQSMHHPATHRESHDALTD